jgi:phosphatidyl-myo-inositol dimannoside synthase
MDILFITQKYHPFVGGAETQMRIVAHDLALTHQVEVATLPRDGASYPDGPIRVHTLKLSTLDCWRMRLLRLIPKPYRNPTSWVGYQFYRSVYLPKLLPLVRGKHVVHALKTEALSRVAEEAARIEGVPFVITPYIHPREKAGAAAKHRLEASFCNRADTVFALIETDRDMLIHLGVPKEKIRLAGVMPLLPDSSDPSGFRRRHGFSDEPIVLFVGRLIETKGCKTILDAAPRVWRDMPKAHFVFAGPADAAAQRLLSERGDQRIRYLGLIDEQEKGDALAACDMFCMPSIAEILPAVYLEAWSYGKAVIGGSAHGLYELIEGNGAGLTVKQDPELLAARLVELLRDKPRRDQMGECGRKLVEQRFSKGALVRAFEGAYKALPQRVPSQSTDSRASDASQTQAVSGFRG